MWKLECSQCGGEFEDIQSVVDHAEDNVPCEGEALYVIWAD